MYNTHQEYATGLARMKACLSSLLMFFVLPTDSDADPDPGPGAFFDPSIRIRDPE
jgi:hypothetical protein